MTRATIATEIGDIDIELYDESAPKAAQNFIELANKGFYDDVIFHRVFICTDDLGGRLPKNYTLFGVVTNGLDVVDKIVSAPRDARDLPNEPVAMTSVTIHPDQG